MKLAHSKIWSRNFSLKVFTTLFSYRHLTFSLKNLFKFFVSVNTTRFTCTVYFLYNMFWTRTRAIVRYELQYHKMKNVC
jgi:hypothetical protein